MPPPNDPVPVLLYGFLGFVGLGPLTYFRGVKSALAGAGITVLTPHVPAVGSLQDRAAAIARFLERSGGEAFVLIGHSMGGLDARFVASHLDPQHRIKSVVTVATPHLGTPVASEVLGGHSLLSVIARKFWRPALVDLTPEARRREMIPDRADVEYVSYAADVRFDTLPFVLRCFAGMMAERNDGLVPVSAAQWGRQGGTITADHLEVVGWRLRFGGGRGHKPFDHISFWKNIVSEHSRPAGVNTGEVRAS